MSSKIQKKLFIASFMQNLYLCRIIYENYRLMKKELIINFQQIEIDNLSEIDTKLVDKARDALKNSYAPYSNFHVASAVLLNNDEIIVSTNQESEVFPSGICAERSLLYYVQSNFSEYKILTMAIVSDSKLGDECYPCGACRQTMCDTEKRNGNDIKIIMVGKDSVTMIDSAKQLLPFTFNLK